MKKYALYLSVLFLIVSCKKPNPAPNIDLTKIEYGAHPLQSFQLHKPDNADENTKVVILVHGGGWVMGYHPDEIVTTFDGRYGWNLLNPLLDAGFACATMKYRTACYNTVASTYENNTNAALDLMIEDIDLVIDYLKQNSNSLGIGSEHFQLVGESGGGHIVMSYGIQANADEKLKSVVSMFGPTELDAQDFKTIINTVPTINVPPPNFFLRKSSNCESVTNQQVKVLNSLRSFADHFEIKINQTNPFLDSISTTPDYMIQKNTALFITHGTDDKLVPKTQAETMLTAMTTKFGSTSCADNDFNCQLKMKLYDNCGHGWTGGNCNKNQVMNNIVSWLEQH